MGKAVAAAESKELEILNELDQDIESGMGQDFKSTDLLIPRITILQDLSPQTKERRAEYVDGARAGMIYNNVNDALETSMLFVPALYHSPYIAWKPRPDGGLVNNDVDPAFLTEENGFYKDGVDRFIGHMRPNPNDDPVKVEVIKTPEWVGIAQGQDWVMPVAISFAGTKAKAARRMNTNIDMTEKMGEDGKLRKYPPFYHTFVMRTALEQSGDNEWFGWAVSHSGTENTDARLRHKGRELRRAFMEDRVTVASPEET
ncbi:MAG: hypothetical protein GY813_09335 [Halieaceae bacterium]|nr:hypothetical protein [Halieaceae bacterium]